MGSPFRLKNKARYPWGNHGFPMLPSFDFWGTPSISTEIPIGSAPMPTAERPCFPLSSPKISTSRSEAPLATCGWSPKSGGGVDHHEQLHDPLDTVERCPDSSLTDAKLIMTRRAEACPAATSRSRPSFPR